MNKQNFQIPIQLRMLQTFPAHFNKGIFFSNIGMIAVGTPGIPG